MANHKTNKSSFDVLKSIFKNKNVIFSLSITGFLVLLFHLLSTITLPGITPGKFTADSNGFAGMLNLLAGGGLSRMSILAVGVSPYITSQIIVQLLSSDLIPPLSRAAKQGERGRRKLEIVTRIITLPFAVAQGYAVIALMLQSSAQTGVKIFGHDALNQLNLGETFGLLFILTAGTYICIFLGDMITKRGVGNGITLLILSGIVSSFFSDFTVAFQTIASSISSSSEVRLLTVILSCTLYVIFYIAILFAVIFVNASTRKIPIQQTGQGLMTDFNDLPYLPIKINSAGVIPVIFASSLMTIPGTIAQFLPDSSEVKWFIVGNASSKGYLTLDSWSGISIFFLLIVMFSFFYSYVQINPQQLAENFTKSGRFIPGIKFGDNTEKHITKSLSRVNWIGAPILGIIAVLPYIVSQFTHIPSGMAVGGTGMIIIVTGTLELWNSIISAATTSGYSQAKGKIETKIYESKENINNDSKLEKLW